jgi:hypothetical protein
LLTDCRLPFKELKKIISAKLPVGFEDSLGAQVGNVVIVCLKRSLYNGDEVEFAAYSLRAQRFQVKKVKQVVFALLQGGGTM